MIKENGEHYTVKVQRCYCPVCDKYSQTEFTGQYGNYYNFLMKQKKD